MAVALLLDELQRQRAKMLPNDRVKKTYILGKQAGQWVTMSIDELIGALQMKQTLAVRYAIEYAQQQEGPKGEKLYIVT